MEQLEETLGDFAAICPDPPTKRGVCPRCEYEMLQNDCRLMIIFFINIIILN